MTQEVKNNNLELIDKSTVVAEIEKMKNKAYPNSDWNHGYVTSCEKLLSFINTLEVKEVNLEKEIELVKGDYEQVDVAWNNDFDFIARHFFELGLKTKGE